MDIYQQIEEKRERILQIAHKHGAGKVRLIGSVARREAGPDSDIDLLVELEPDRTLLDHAALVEELQALLGVKVDVASDRGLRQRIKTQVLAEAVPL